MNEPPVEPTELPTTSLATGFVGAFGIETVGLQRSFGAVRAVDHVSFVAPEAAVTALIGPNGSGKTTLLLMLAGLLKPDAGTATVGGHDLITHNQRARTVVGWMPDVFGTWDALTCFEILTAFAQAYGLSVADGRRRSAELLEQLHLAEFTDRPARVLSRGQRQRLGLARALVHDPAVLLLDEPASGLDPRSRIELRDLLRDLAHQGKTVLVSSHVLSELEEVYDHAVFLSKGRTVEAGVVQQQTVKRGWRLESLDPAGLRTFLDQSGIPYTSSTGGEVTVQLAGLDSARQLIRAAVAADLPLHTIAPVSGRLEEAYLALDEERL